MSQIGASTSDVGSRIQPAQSGVQDIEVYRGIVSPHTGESNGKEHGK